MLDPAPRPPGRLLLLGALAAACAGAPPRFGSADAVPLWSRPDAATLARLRVDQSSPETSAIALVDAAPGGERSAAAAGRGTLSLEQLLRSVEAAFPVLLAAEEEVAIAEGELLAARGGFDLRVKAMGDYGVDGYYQNEQTKLSLEQPTGALGATFFGGYKLGTGDFPLYDGGLRSNEGGEVSAGVRLPLLAGRAIDPRRLAEWRARVALEQADPKVAEKRLQVTRKAAGAYWKWVAAGQKRLVYERLLRLAETRQTAIEQAASLGDVAPLAVDDNQRLVVERRAIVVAAERELQRAAIALSLYLRGPDGRPRRPGADELPLEFPAPAAPAELALGDDAERALRLRPELRRLALELDRARLELEQVRNDRLPRLDVGVAASKDLGGAASDPDDKGPFDLDLFFRFDVPLQRRSAEGKAQTLEAKLRQLQRELQFARESVQAEVQDAASELAQTWEAIGLVRETARLAAILEEAERGAFLLGQSNLIDVNIREQQTAAAAVRLVDSYASYFAALADYRAALGATYDEARR